MASYELGQSEASSMRNRPSRKYGPFPGRVKTHVFKRGLWRDRKTADSARTWVSGMMELRVVPVHRGLIEDVERYLTGRP